MGCLCETGVKENIKKSENETLSMKHGSKKSYNDTGDEIKSKGLSINQATFVYEKSYKTFMKEYEIIEFIGRGKSLFFF